MKVPGDIKKFIKNAEADSNSEVNKAVLEGLIRELDKSDNTPSAAQPLSVRRRIMASRMTKLAAVAVIVVAVGFLLYWGPGAQPEAPQVSQVTKSPAEMLTFVSLTMAYRRGGIEAVEQQCEKAFEMLGPRPAALSTQDILKELNGS
ncbi:MAG: hypothetical protein ACYTEL_16820 [Planctomycetota bacterium]|jgi:hypothetical protein